MDGNTEGNSLVRKCKCEGCRPGPASRRGCPTGPSPPPLDQREIGSQNSLSPLPPACSQAGLCLPFQRLNNELCYGHRLLSGFLPSREGLRTLKTSPPCL